MRCGSRWLYGRQWLRLCCCVHTARRRDVCTHVVLGTSACCSRFIDVGWKFAEFGAFKNDLPIGSAFDGCCY